MDANRRAQIMQRWNVIQHDLIPELKHEIGVLTPKLEKVIHTLEWVRIEEYVEKRHGESGRPSHERAWLNTVSLNDSHHKFTLPIQNLASSSDAVATDFAFDPPRVTLAAAA